MQFFCGDDAVATQAEAEAGSSTAVKRWTPERVGQAISALASDSSWAIESSMDIPIGPTRMNYCASPLP